MNDDHPVEPTTILPLLRTCEWRPAPPILFPIGSFEKDPVMNEDQIRGSLRNLKGEVEKGVGDVASDTRWQADGVIDQVAGRAQNIYGHAKETVSDVIDGAPHVLADAGDRARDLANRGRSLADKQVKDNPWVLVAAAGVAGYALSWLLHGQRD